MSIDITFYIIMSFAVFKGYSKGFVIGIFSFLAFIVGLAAALKLSALLAGYLENSTGVSGKWLVFLSFVLVFLVVVIVVNLGARVIKRTVGFAMLGWVDKLGGIFLYILIYTLIFSILLFFAEKTFLLNQTTIEESRVYKWIAPWGPLVIDNLGKIIPIFKGMFNELQAFFESAGSKLHQ